MSGLSKEVLFLRGNDQDSEPFDDSELLDCYNSHFDSVKKKVLQRMGYTNSEINDVIRPAGKQKKKAQAAKQATKWSVGARCCSVFSEDGNTYEATITELYPEKQTCRVQYVGYGNEEEVPLSSLTPSQGRKAREVQVKAAAAVVGIPNMDHSENYSEDDSVQVNVSQKRGKSPRNNKQRQVPSRLQDASMGMPQFPSPHSMRMPQLGGMPPVMPSIVPPMPFNMMENNSEQTEAFSAMLMSWYMSGYYTGYYEAFSACRKQRNNKK